jgi:hypothetical protein
MNVCTSILIGYVGIAAAGLLRPIPALEPSPSIFIDLEARARATATTFVPSALTRERLQKEKNALVPPAHGAGADALAGQAAGAPASVRFPHVRDRFDLRVGPTTLGGAPQRIDGIFRREVQLSHSRGAAGHDHHNQWLLGFGVAMMVVGVVAIALWGGMH